MIRLSALILALWLCLGGIAYASNLRLATTTSTENSGLLDRLLPLFTRRSGIEVDVVAVGTGQALELGRRGDVEALLVHHREGELAFIKSGHGTERRDVMYNDFVIVGPPSDPAKLRHQTTAAGALKAIAESVSPFLSRGDDSGTHRKERALWQDAGLTPDAESGWYRETGAGMGRTLNTAVQMNAYTLTDRGTWIAFANKADFAILLQTDPPLNNPYSSILVTSPLLSTEARRRARMWHEWLTGPEGQAAIGDYRLNGEPLFFPSARTPMSN